MQLKIFDDQDPGQLVPARIVLNEMGRMQRRLSNLQRGLSVLEQLIRSDKAANQPRRHHSFEPEALVYLERLFVDSPGLRTFQLIKQLEDEAAVRGWRIGSRKTLYRVIKELRLGARLHIPDTTEGG